MAYHFKTDQTPQHGFRRIACSQIDKALDEIADEKLDIHETVHQVRKRGKKIRGLLRLVRPQVNETYSEENKTLRNAARRLSHVRDASTMIECLDRLMHRFAEEVDAQKFVSLRHNLESRRENVAEDQSLEGKLDDYAETFEKLRDRAQVWSVSAEDFDAMAGGMKKTYRRARKTFDVVIADPTAAHLHEWRKRIKYHWYHMRLLRAAWPKPMAARVDALDTLSDLLGDDHDLAVLQRTIANSECFDAGVVAGLHALITARRRELQAAALPLGRRLLIDKPRHLARRIECWWTCATAHDDLEEVFDEGAPEPVAA